MKNQKALRNIALFSIIALALIAVLWGCTQITNPPGPTPGPDQTGGGTITPPITIDSQSQESTQELKKFSNLNEVRAFLAQSSLSQGAGAGVSRSLGIADAFMAEEAQGAPSTSGAKVAGAQDYSQTNVQVQGVDEADFVKNDDRYIYMLTANKLIIVDALDTRNAKIISQTKIKDERSDEEKDQDYYNRPQAKQLFVNKDKLALFVEGYEKTFYFNKYDIEPIPSQRQVTYVYIYDISNRENPKLLENYKVSGSYYQSRMIDNIIYIVSQENTGYDYIPGPIILKESSPTVIRPDIYYFDNPDQDYNFNTLLSINLDNQELIDSKTFLLGYANTLMVSENNIYIAYQKQSSWRWWGPWYRGQNYDKERFYDVIVPQLRGELKEDIQNIINQDLKENQEWEQISKVLSDFFTKLDSDESLKDEYQSMLEDISLAVEEYDTKKALEDTKTVVHKINIDNGQINYQTKGEVYGTLLNQFSLDEYQGNLRLATTVNAWNRRENIQHNNVYVLDKNLNKIGEVTNIATDERIYAARFLGDKLYLVTFKQIDPFFVIDLSNPNAPKVLGELKLPGYSSYLHPYDETHIIGIGKEATEEGRVQGLKIALFDVSNFEAPKLIEQVNIGDSGSDSPALYDHKAFLFSKTKNLLVLPVTEVTQRDRVNEYRYSNTIWHGAYVLKVTEDELKETGKVQHSSTRSDYFNWYDQASVQRSLYLDNNLYTISNKYIKINDLANELEELNSITLPQAKDNYGGPIYYNDVVVPREVAVAEK